MGFSSAWSIPKFEAKGFPKASEILSFHWGVSQQRRSWENDPHGSGQVHDYSAVRKIDKHSHLFFTACAYGEDVGTIQVFLMKGSEKTIEIYATYTFEGCFISSVRPGGSSVSEDPLEEIVVSFSSMKSEYKKS